MATSSSGDGHAARLVGRPVLEPALVVRGVAVGPAPVHLGTGFLQGEAAPSGLGEVAVLAAQADDLAGPERGVVHAGVEGHEPLAPCMRTAPLLADVGNPGVASVHGPHVRGPFRSWKGPC
jgi:hypothetical protein